jgi:hypothetical protein
MGFPTFTLFAFGGLALFLAGCLARLNVRGRLRARGMRLPDWDTPITEFEMYGEYVSQARKGYVPRWPIVFTGVGMFGGILMTFASIIAHNKH